MNQKIKLLNRLIQTESNKEGKIIAYIAVHINPYTQKYFYNYKSLSNKFKCSLSQVDKAITFFRLNRYYYVNKKYIKINYAKYVSDKIKKGNN